MYLVNVKFTCGLFNQWSVYTRYLVKKLCKLKHPYWAFHSLRHRFASLLSKKNTPIYEIMSLLGHSSIETTQIYLQLLP